MFNFGNNLKKLRKEAGFTQTELAGKVGTTVQSVSKWECGKGMPDISQIVPLSNVLGVSTDELLGVGENEKADEASLDKAMRTELAKYSGNAYMYYSESLIKVYRMGREFLMKYPSNYSVMLCSAGYLSGYLTGAKLRYFELSEPGFNDYHKQGTVLLKIIIGKDRDTTRRIRAERLLIDYYLLKDDYASAESAAKSLPETGGIRASSLLKVYDAACYDSKGLKLAEELARFKSDEYLEAMRMRARRTSAYFGNSDRPRAIARWLEYKEEAERADSFFGGPYPECEHTKSTLADAYMMLCGEYLAIDDMDSALKCVEEATDIAEEIYDEAKKHESRDALEKLKNKLKRYPEWCHNYILPDPDNVLTRQPRFMACVERLDKLN